MNSNILNIHHTSLIVANTQASLKFYTGVLGLKQLPRPKLPYFGAWLAIGSQQVHLLELENPDPISNRPKHGGRDRHIAFNVLKLDLIKDALDQAKLSYTLSISGRRALFCRDLDGNALEFIEKTDCP